MVAINVQGSSNNLLTPFSLENNLTRKRVKCKTCQISNLKYFKPLLLASNI